jgi:hypothetical protein
MSFDSFPEFSDLLRRKFGQFKMFSRHRFLLFRNLWIGSTSVCSTCLSRLHFTIQHYERVDFVGHVGVFWMFGGDCYARSA